MPAAKPSGNRYPRIGSLRSVEAFRNLLTSFAPELEVDDEILTADRSPLALPLKVRDFAVGNRWTIHPMEGWDGEEDGSPGELTRRRWRHFGESGAKLIWGGEAVAVRSDSRANPNQLVIADRTLAGLEALRRTLLDAHAGRFGGTDDLLLGLQLTHSGRFSRPHRMDRPEPRVAYRHPILDRRVGIENDKAVLSDAEVDGLIEDFVVAARRAWSMGFRFVDIKHCHGYLLHEFLGAHVRPGPYGGSFENRTRLLREIVRGVRSEAPGCEIAVRVSLFDTIPFRSDPQASDGGRTGLGVPEDSSGRLPYRFGFGVDPDDPTRFDLAEGKKLLALFRDLDIRLVNISGGSPYYNPHVQRPALYPPSDGYRPPEDPLAGVVRHLRIVRDLKREYPDLILVGSALSYLQEYLPHVAQSLVRNGWMDSVGIGRMVLSYWDLPADSLERGELSRKRLCRTFSDCTTAPRNGLVSGCFPLDPHYDALPEAATLRQIKSALPSPAKP